MAAVRKQFDSRSDYYEKMLVLRRAEVGFAASHRDDLVGECALQELDWAVRSGRRREAEWVHAKLLANIDKQPELRALADLAMLALDLDPLAYPGYQDDLVDAQRQQLLQLQERVALVSKAAKSPRVAARALLLKAQILAAQRQFFAANQALASLQKTYGDDKAIAAEAALYAALILPATSDVDAAVRALQETAAKFPDNRDVALRAARAAVGMLDKGDGRLEALVALRTAAKGVPLVPALAHMRIAEIFAAQGKETVAANELRQIVDLYPESPEIMLEAAARLVPLEEKAERYANAEAMLRQLGIGLAKAPLEQQQRAQALLIQFLLNRGEGLLKNQEPGMATKKYDQVIALDPLNLAAHRGKIDAAYARHEAQPKAFADLEEAYGKKATENPGSAAWVYIYGYALTYEIDRSVGPRNRLGAIDVAIAQVEAARQIDAQLLYVHQTLGWLYMQKNFTSHQYFRAGSLTGVLSARAGMVREFFGMGDPDWRELAIDAYQSAYFLSRPESLERASLALDLGQAYFSLRNFQKSLNYFLQRVKLLATIPMRDPRAEAILYERAGRSAFQTDELELAETLQRQALAAWERVDNEQRIAYSIDALALTLRERGQFPAAIELYERLEGLQQRLGQAVNRIGTLSNRGYCYFMNSQLNQALVDFAAAEDELNKVSSDESLREAAQVKAAGDGIKVDLGGGGSAAKGFDLFARRILVLTFRGQIYEKLGRIDLALATYEEKLRLLVGERGGDKQTRGEEIAILQNNIGALRLQVGMHTPAKAAFQAAAQAASGLRSGDKKEQMPAELINQLDKARVELRLASLGLLYAVELDADLNAMDSSIAALRPAYKGGGKAQGKALAQLLAVSATLRTVKAGDSAKAGAKAALAEAAGIMKDLATPPPAMVGPLLAYNSLDAGKVADPALASTLDEFRKAASEDPNLQWRVLAGSDDPSKAFEALDRFLAGGGTLRAVTDRHLARRVFEQLLAPALAKGDVGQISLLIRRFALMRLEELAMRSGLDKARTRKLTALQTSAQLTAALGERDALLLAGRGLNDEVHLILITKAQTLLAQSPMAAESRLRPEFYTELLRRSGLAAALPAAGATLYLVPDGDLFDVPWEGVGAGNAAFADKYTLSFLPAADLLPALVNGRRMAKGSLAYLGPASVGAVGKEDGAAADKIAAPSLEHTGAARLAQLTADDPEFVAANSKRELTVIALDGQNPLLAKLQDAALVHADLPFWLNDVEAASSTLAGGGHGANAYLNDLKLAALGTKALPNTTALIFPQVLRNNTELQISGDGDEGWHLLSFAALVAGVPTVLMHEATTANHGEARLDWPTFYRALATMSVAEGMRAARLPGRLLGYPGVPAEDEVAFAKTHLPQAVDEAEDARADQDFVAAAGAYKRALYYAQRLGKPGSDTPLLKGLVQALAAARDYDAALRYQMRITTMLQPAPAVNSPGKKSDDDDDAAVDYARSLVDAAVLAVLANQAGEATHLLDQAEVIFQAQDMRDQLGKVWHYRAINEENQRHFPATLAAYEKAYGYYLKSKPEEAAAQLLNIGNVYNRDLSDNLQALDYYAKAIDAYKKLGKPDAYLPVLIDAANTQMAIGELEKAISTLETEVLPKIDRQKQRVLWVRASQILANAFYRAGLFQAAKDLNQQALAEAAKVDAKLTRVNLQLDASSLQAMILAKLGRYKEAFRGFHDAITTAQQYDLKSQVALLYNNYGFWARNYGAVDQSIDFFTTALHLDQELKSRSSVAYDNRNMGLSVILKGDYSRAQDLLRSALADSEELHLVYNAAYCHFGLGDIAMRQKDWQTAEASFRKALDVAQKGYMQDFVWRAYAGVATALVEQTQRQAAAQSFGQAVKVIESMRAGLQSEDSRDGFFSDVGVQAVYSDYAALLMQLGQTEQAWGIAERSRSRAFVDALGNQKARIVKAQAAPTGKAPTPQQRAELASFDKVSVIAKDELNRLLGPETALIEYQLTETQLLIWVLNHGTLTGQVVPVTARELTGKVKAFRELMENYSTTDYLGQELADLLLTPITKQLAGVKRLAVVPHGALHFLPFAALPLAADLPLMERFAIFYLDSATLARYTLAGQPKPLGAAVPMLAVASPQPVDASLPELPFVAREIEAIARYYPRQTLLSGAAATKAKLTAAAPQVDILHIATHGIFRPNDPGESRLVLAAPSPEAALDELSPADLSVADIFTLPSTADLVTLSACNSGMGRISAGDEIIGMDRAFFYSGASTVVASLWRISDVASAVTMKRFYRYLAQGEDRAEAMRHAQRVVRRYFSHPAYWSAFRLLGDYR